MKRLTAIFLALLMLLPAGCGGSDTPAPPETPSQTPETTGTVLSLQDPSAFLGGSTLAETEPGATGIQKLTFTLAPEEDVLALQYADLLLNGAYQLEQADRVESENDTAQAYACYFRYTGDRELPVLDMKEELCHLFIGIRRDNGESTTFTIIYPEGVAFADWGARADRSVVQPEVLPSPMPSAEPAPTDPSVIPDFLENDPSGAFRAGNSAFDGAVCFLADDTTYYSAAETYVQLLIDMGYTLSSTDEKAMRTWSRMQWDLYYEGADWPPIGDNTHVRVKHLASDRDGVRKTEISITYSEGITYGGEEQYRGGGGGSAGGGSWDPNLPDHSKLQCLTCDGTGDCPSCGGYGEKTRGGITSDCTRCDRGKCPTCHGSGTR